MILGKNLYQGGVLYIYACANPAETVQLMSVICIDSTHREVSLSVYRQALFGSSKICAFPFDAEFFFRSKRGCCTPNSCYSLGFFLSSILPDPCPEPRKHKPCFDPRNHHICENIGNPASASMVSPALHSCVVMHS